jgi:hypothetical protein
MMPPDIIFFLHQQRRQEMMWQAEQMRLVRAVRRRPEPSGRVFQRVRWLTGSVLRSWGCALQGAGQVMAVAEKECFVCQL